MTDKVLTIEVVLPHDGIGLIGDPGPTIEALIEAQVWAWGRVIKDSPGWTGCLLWRGKGPWRGVARATFPVVAGLSIVDARPALPALSVYCQLDTLPQGEGWIDRAILACQEGASRPGGYPGAYVPGITPATVDPSRRPTPLAPVPFAVWQGTGEALRVQLPLSAPARGGWSVGILGHRQGAVDCAPTQARLAQPWGLSGRGVSPLVTVGGWVCLDHLSRLSPPVTPHPMVARCLDSALASMAERARGQD